MRMNASGEIVWSSVVLPTSQAPVYYSCSTGLQLFDSRADLSTGKQSDSICCKCGSDLLGESSHSDWCPKFSRVGG